MIYFVGNNEQIFDSEQFYTATIEDVVKYCSSKTILGVDTETTGLDFISNSMTMFQIGDDTHQYVIDTRVISIEPLRDILTSQNIVKIFHNAKFDINFIRSCANILCDNIYDTMLAEKIINCGKEYSNSLKNTVKRHLGIDLPKLAQSSFINNTDSQFTTDQIVYGANDVKYLIEIHSKQASHIIVNKLKNVVELENRAVLAFADIEFNGLDLDKDRWIELSKESLKTAEHLQFILNNHIIQDFRLSKFIPMYVQGDLFGTVSKQVDVNWDSPKQVLDVFQCLIPKLENVNGKAMYKYRNKYPLINDYINYKEKMKIATSYGEAFLNNLSTDDKIHTSFNQILDTGRVSSSKPNMQQIPASNRFRNCFTAPEGWSFVSADYASQELNVIAFGSDDPVWMKALKQGQDLHSTCAELVYGKDWTNYAETDCKYMKDKSRCECPTHKKLRTNVKTINFGLAYGMGPNKLADTLNISKQDAKQLIEDYFTAFPNIKGFLEKLANFGKQYGYIKTFPPFNRRRWFVNWYPKIWSDESASMEMSSIERASKNTPIQGASADMTKLALVYIYEYLADKQLPVKVVMTVHDQIDTICADRYVDKWSETLTYLMEKAAKKVVTNGLLKADVNISKSWEK
jgi:DNA polymerase I-like protein with 3'-5' exonuclease and polymerase domains